MKRFLTVLLAALMILLAGCTKTPATDGDTTTTQPTTAQPTENPNISKNLYDYEINGINLCDDIEELKKKLGSEFVDKKDPLGMLYSYKNTEIGSFFTNGNEVTSIAVLSGEYIGFEISKSTKDDVVKKYGQPSFIKPAKYGVLDETDDFDKDKFKRYIYEAKEFELRFYFENDTLKQIEIWGYSDALIELLDKENLYYYTLPEKNKKYQEVYDKYIEPYFQAYLFEYPWNEQDHSKIKYFVEIYMAAYGYDDFWKNYPKNDNYEHILDYEDMKKKVQSVMAISDNEFKDIMSEFYNKETNQYLYHGGLGGPYVIYYITDVKTENNIMTIYIDQYDDHLIDEKSYDLDKNGRVYAVPRTKLTIKIKLEDNGKFKFLSNEIEETEEKVLDTQKYIQSIPKMSKENQEIYDKYIASYAKSWLFADSWDEKNHSNLVLVGSIFSAFYGPSISKDFKTDSYGRCIVDFDIINKTFKGKMVITDDEIRKCFDKECDKEGNNYKIHYAHGGPFIIQVITNVKTDNNVMTIDLDIYESELVEEGKTFKYDKDGNICPIPIKNSTVKIKLEDNGGFKFLSNVIKDV